jgi:peptidoglycan hydrolase CwlO-like protein
MAAMAPGAPRPNRTMVNAHLNNRMAATAPNQMATEKASTTAHR